MMHAHVRHQGQGWQAHSVVGDWGGGVGGLKRLRPQRSEVADGGGEEKKKISGGKEEKAAR